MKFTVVIPLFNKERHISRSIDSILNQTIKDFEIIIVDDGSTDNSVAEVEKYNDKRIRLVRQDNSGVSVARNKGIILANYDYIGFLDADDTWEPDFLESISKLINRYPNVGAYATAYQFRYRNQNQIPKCFFDIPENWYGIINDYFKYSIKSQLISASSVVIPKKVFSSIGMFDFNLNRGEDLDMWYRIAMNYDIAFFNRVCATYYQDSDNRACVKKHDLERSFINYAEELLIKNRCNKKYTIYFEEYMIKNIIRKARHYINEGNNKKARQILYKYRYTKYNKAYYFKTYVLSWIPNQVRKFILKFKNSNKMILF